MTIPLILIFEDTPEIADTLIEVTRVKFPDALILVAEDANSVLAWIQREQFLAILIDVSLLWRFKSKNPNYSPNWLLSEIQRRQKDAQIIWMTGDSMEEVKNLVVRGDSLFLQKPFTSSELSAILRQAVTKCQNIGA